MPQKVWDIGAAAALTRRREAPTSIPTPTSGPSPDAAAPPSTKRRWSRVVSAYAAGWLVLPFWCAGRSRIVWMILGYGSALGLASAALCWPRVTKWFDTTPQGNVLFLAVVPTLALVLGLCWTRAVHVATRRRANATPSPTSWQHDSWVVGLLGFVVPGLGLLIAGHPRRAALAFGIVGPLAAAALVLANASWLWRRSQSTVPAGLAEAPLEVALLVAGAILAGAILAWIVQALDGARLASSSVGTRMPQVLGATLVASLALFAVTARPAAFARTLHASAVELQRDGYRWIPLAFSEAAIRFDPARAAYLATSAQLDDALDRSNAAAAKWLTIAARAQEYGALAPGGAARPIATASFDQDVWVRVSRLVR